MFHVAFKRMLYITKHQLASSLYHGYYQLVHFFAGIEPLLANNAWNKWLDSPRLSTFYSFHGTKIMPGPGVVGKREGKELILFSSVMPGVPYVPFA